MSWMPPPDPRLPPKENDDPVVQTPPKPGTAWEKAMAGTEDVRCSFREAHLYNFFHALGINPHCPWPPPPELEIYLATGGDE